MKDYVTWTPKNYYHNLHKTFAYPKYAMYVCIAINNHKMKIRTYFLTKEPMGQWAWGINGNLCEQWFNLTPLEIYKAVRKYRPVKWRIEPFRFIKVFFSYLGHQNDYLFPNEATKGNSHPFEKPHLWKTRFGFNTAWQIAKIACK